MSRKIDNTELVEFYACYGNVVVEEIRKIVKEKQAVLGVGTVPYVPDCPDPDPEITLTLECMQDTFNPKWITEKLLEEVEIKQSIFAKLQAKLKNICFLAKALALPVGTQCFQCRKKISSAYQYTF